MSVHYPPLTRRNFPFHLKKASSLLKSALNREALHTLDPWKDFLNYIERITGQFDFATIAATRKTGSQFELTDVVYTSWPEDAISGLLEQNLFNDPLLLSLHTQNSQSVGDCFAISDIISLREYQKTFYYNEFAYPKKVDSMAQILFPIDGKDLGALAIFPPSGCYEVKPIVKHFLSALVEDIGMALNHRRLIRSLRAAQGSLNQLNLGVILLDERGFVEVFNEQAKTILNKGNPLFIRNNRLYMIDPGNTERLNDLFYRLLRDQCRQREQQIILKSSDGSPPLQMMVLGLDDNFSKSLIGGGGSVAIFINLPSAQDKILVDLPEVFREFYGCGEKQAQVAALYAQGFSEVEIAKKMDIGRETVRSHLSRSLDKFSASGQFSGRRKQAFWDIAQKHGWPLKRNK